MLKKKLKPKKKSSTLDASRRVMEGIEGDEKWWRPKLGENRIRILPSNREDNSIVVPSILHYGFKVDGKGRAFPCMSSLKKPCPMCQLIAHHDSDTDADVQDLLRDIGPRKQFLFNIIDRKGDGRVQILSAGIMIAREINNLLNDSDYGDFTDPETGRDIKISKTGEGKFGTKYSTRIAPKESPIDVEGWEGGMYNLAKERYREIPSEKQYLKYIEECFGNVLEVSTLGIEESEDDEDEDDVDEDIDDDEDEDEEEEEKPKKKKRKSPTKPTRAEDL